VSSVISQPSVLEFPERATLPYSVVVKGTALGWSTPSTPSSRVWRRQPCVKTPSRAPPYASAHVAGVTRFKGRSIAEA